MPIEFVATDNLDALKPRITVIGVGGAGCNAIANMINSDVAGVDYVVANTDAQSLHNSPADHKIQLGLKITQGLGAGARPEIGRAAAEETLDQIDEALNGVNMVFIAAGMGGGTGTGAAPVIAKSARDKGILTVGVVTKPFGFEGSRRMKAAESGIEELQGHVDTLIVIPNQNLFLIANPSTTFKEAFQMADEVLQQGVRGITDLMVMPGLINLDFADVRSVMAEMGKAMMGTGEADGERRAIEAAEQAIANPLLDGVSMQGAKGVIVSITGGEDMRLMEIEEAASHIKELVDPDANIIWGSAFNNDLDGRIRVSVVATGIEADGQDTAVRPGMTMEAPRPSFAAAPARPAEAPAPPPAPAAVDRFSVPEPDAEADMQADTEAEVGMEAGASETEGEGSSPLTSWLRTAPAEELAANREDRTPSPVRRPLVSRDEPVLSNAPAPPPSIRSKLATAAKSAETASAPEQGGSYGDDDETLDLTTPLGAGDTTDEPVAPAAPRAPRVAGGGGTLFERMSNMARGGVGAGNDRAADTDLPRFLNRNDDR